MTTKTFSDFALPQQLMKALERAQFTTPTPIQEQAIPLALQGQDILGSAQTGTGKTGAFGIPLIAKLMEDPDAVALVLTPTRELAAQVMAAMQQWIAVPNIKTALLIGGEPMPKQYRQLHMRPRLIVGTPGRVNDHLLRKTLRLDNTRFLVLDETDRMLDMGFGIQLDAILNFLPAERQTMMFSATMPSNIMKLSAKYLNQPQRISVGNSNAVATKIRQEMIQTTEADKYKHLVDQLEKNEGSVIIFVKTKFGADKLATKLCREEYQADAIHGDLKQNRRDRVIKAFREKKYRILVATDVAARGLDIPHIETVINYDMPQAPEDYIHRIGRTARAGAEGYAVNLVAPIDGGKWKAIHRLLNPGAQPERNERPANGRKDNGGYGGGRGGFGKSASGNAKGGFPGFSNNRDRGNSYDRREEGSTSSYAKREGGFGRSHGGQQSQGDFPAFANKNRGNSTGGYDRRDDSRHEGYTPHDNHDFGQSYASKGQQSPGEFPGFANKNRGNGTGYERRGEGHTDSFARRDGGFGKKPFAAGGKPAGAKPFGAKNGKPGGFKAAGGRAAGAAAGGQRRFAKKPTKFAA